MKEFKSFSFIFVVVVLFSVIAWCIHTDKVHAAKQPIIDVATIIAPPQATHGSVFYIGFLKQAKKHVVIDADLLNKPLALNEEVTVLSPTYGKAWWTPK